MATPSDIFARQRLTAGQLRAVAERRFDDAQALCDTGQNARANGAQYLAGIVIEILLKAQLMRYYPVEARKRQNELTDADRPVWSLIWRSHDLGEMLEKLPDLRVATLKQGERAGRPYMTSLLGICASWTIFARCSTATTTMADARDMLERVRELKEVLK